MEKQLETERKRSKLLAEALELSNKFLKTPKFKKAFTINNQILKEYKRQCRAK